MGFSVSGTLRSNLDPFGLYDDTHLWDALKRAHLVDTNEQQSPSPQTTTQGDAQAVGGRFDLDTPIDGEGSNLSVGQVRFSPVLRLSRSLIAAQRSLVSLARALVHETKILILDEATGPILRACDLVHQLTFCAASVDYETDGKIQNTIATEFKERTILCIARKSRSDRFCSAFVDHHVDRLRTIIAYDRICVLDAGTIAVRILWLLRWSAR